MAQPSLFIERSREKGNSLPFHFSRVSFLSLSLPLSFHSKKRCLEGVERNRIRGRWRCSAIPFLAFGEVIKERRWRGWIDRKSNSWRRDGSSLAVLFIRRGRGGGRGARNWWSSTPGTLLRVASHHPRSWLGRYFPPFSAGKFHIWNAARPTTFFKLIYCRETRYERQ